MTMRQRSKTERKPKRRKPKLLNGVRHQKGAEQRTYEYIEKIAHGLKWSPVRKD